MPRACLHAVDHSQARKTIPANDTNIELQVVQAIIKPETAEAQCRYTDVIVDGTAVGRPSFFISHTWADRFCHMVDAVEQHFEGVDAAERSAAILWIDIFVRFACAAWTIVRACISALKMRVVQPRCGAQAINQHDTSEALQNDLQRMETVLASVECTLFCLDTKGVALGRIWCLFEIWCVRTCARTGGTAQGCATRARAAPSPPPSLNRVGAPWPSRGVQLACMCSC